MAAKKAKKKSRAKAKVKKSRVKTKPAAKKTARRPAAKVKAAKARPAKARPAKAKKSKAAAKAKKPVKAAKKPAKKPANKPRQKTMGEGNYAAARKFDNDQSSFVKRNAAKIPALGKAAEAALEGPECDSLREAEATAAARSRDGFDS
jgi:hypothetical protein